MILKESRPGLNLICQREPHKKAINEFFFSIVFIQCKYNERSEASMRDEFIAVLDQLSKEDIKKLIDLAKMFLQASVDETDHQD